MEFLFCCPPVTYDVNIKKPPAELDSGRTIICPGQEKKQWRQGKTEITANSCGERKNIHFEKDKNKVIKM